VWKKKEGEGGLEGGRGIGVGGGAGGLLRGRVGRRMSLGVE